MSRNKSVSEKAKAVVATSCPIIEDDPIIPRRGTPGRRRCCTLEPPKSRYVYTCPDNRCPISVFDQFLFHGTKAVARLARNRRRSAQERDHHAEYIIHELVLPQHSLYALNAESEMSQNNVVVRISTDPEAMKHWRENDAGILRGDPFSRTTGTILRQTWEWEKMFASSELDYAEEEDPYTEDRPKFWLPTLLAPPGQ